MAEAAPVRKSAICFHNLGGYGDNALPLTTKMIALESFLLLPLVPLKSLSFEGTVALQDSINVWTHVALGGPRFSWRILSVSLWYGDLLCGDAARPSAVPHLIRPHGGGERGEGVFASPLPSLSFMTSLHTVGSCVKSPSPPTHVFPRRQ